LQDSANNLLHLSTLLFFKIRHKMTVTGHQFASHAGDLIGAIPVATPGGMGLGKLANAIHNSSHFKVFQTLAYE
jgi:hypothetical protein